jgi:4'-phosphopantetheinyl transferase
MFRYVLVRASEYPLLDSGQAWPGFLSSREDAILAGLEFLPRRRKWLLGRAAAKRLVRQLSGPQPVAEAGISVLNRPSGEPFVLVEGRGEWEFPISISHRSEVGLAAVPEDRGARIGADIETVEPRDPALVRQFFTSGEAELVVANGKAADEVVARIWSAKEAVLKLLGLGLRLDTRGIAVNLHGEPFLECPAGWQPLAVKVGVEAPAPPVSRLLRVVWRYEANHVLTVAVAG